MRTKKMTNQELLEVLLNENGERKAPPPLENGNDLMSIIVENEILDLFFKNPPLHDFLILRDWRMVRYCINMHHATEEEVKYYVKVFADYGMFDEKETLKILGITSTIKDTENKCKNDIKPNSNSYKGNIIPILMWHFGNVSICSIHNIKTEKTLQDINYRVAPLHKNLYRNYKMEMHYCPKCKVIIYPIKVLKN